MAQSEDRLQQECYLWFHNTYPQFRGLLFHAPNGGNRNAREGAKFKAMGVFPGVADLLFIFNNRFYAIELKTATGRQSMKQKLWAITVREQGVKYFVVRDLKNFKYIINSIINGKKSR